MVASPALGGATALLEQPSRDPGPAPALLDDAPRTRRPERVALGRRRARAASSSRSRRSPASPVGNDDERRAATAGSAASSPAATSARPEWRATTRRAARRGRLGGDHPERLGEHARHDAGVGEREQVAEVAMLERAGEQRRDARAQRACASSAARSGPKPTTTTRASSPASASSSTSTPFCGISFPK